MSVYTSEFKLMSIKSLSEGEKQLRLTYAAKQYMQGDLTLAEFQKREADFAQDYESAALEVSSRWGLYFMLLQSVKSRIGFLK
jgi:hypothetical protein